MWRAPSSFVESIYGSLVVVVDVFAVVVVPPVCRRRRRPRVVGACGSSRAAHLFVRPLSPSLVEHGPSLDILQFSK